MPLPVSSTTPRNPLRPVAAPRQYRSAPSLEAAERGGKSLRLGQQGPAVSALQQQLNQVGVQPALAVDGKFGPDTDLAVRTFQLRNGLDVDGKAGPQTLSALRGGARLEPSTATRHRSDAVASLGEVPVSSTASAGPANVAGRTRAGLDAALAERPGQRHVDLENAVRGLGTVVQRGDSGPAIGQLQDRLSRLGYGVAQSEQFGPQTETLVKQFQADHQVQQNGQVGRTTLDAIEQAERNQPLDRAIANGNVLRRGSRGQAVQDLQGILGRAGYPVAADAAFGAETEAAVRRFQADHQIEVTGAVGAVTCRALQRARPAGGDERALATPVLRQHDSGSYPGGYCATTALRMALRLEGLPDPGADSVALGGSHPYSPGSGSSGSLLAARARELGLSDASYTTGGTLDDVKAELARGHAVPIGGEGRFVGTYADGSGRIWDHSYRGGGHWMLAVGYDAANRRFIVNDPDRGARMFVDESAFARFFTPDGPGTAWMISY